MAARHSVLEDKKVVLLLILALFFIANTLVAEFIGVKIFAFDKLLGLKDISITLFGERVQGLNLTAGAILWPFVFIMTDVINEYFGAKVVKYLSYMAIAIVFYSFFIIYGAVSLPPNEWWQFQSGISGANVAQLADMNLAFNKIMGQGMWIIVGSMIAFLVGQILDVAIFHKIKKITGEKWVALRATGSTLISQLIDSYVVLLIAFWIGADWNLSLVLAIGTVNYIYKFLMAILLTPLIYLAHYIIDQFLGEELSQSLKIEAQNPL